MTDFLRLSAAYGISRASRITWRSRRTSLVIRCAPEPKAGLNAEYEADLRDSRKSFISITWNIFRYALRFGAYDVFHATSVSCRIPDCAYRKIYLSAVFVTFTARDVLATLGSKKGKMGESVDVEARDESAYVPAIPRAMNGWRQHAN